MEASNELADAPDERDAGDTADKQTKLERRRAKLERQQQRLGGKGAAPGGDPFALLIDQRLTRLERAVATQSQRCDEMAEKLEALLGSDDA